MFKNNLFYDQDAHHQKKVEKLNTKLSDCLGTLSVGISKKNGLNLSEDERKELLIQAAELISKGADQKIQDVGGLATLHILALHPTQPIFNLISRMVDSNLLNTEVKDRENKTPLQVCLDAYYHFGQDPRLLQSALCLAKAGAELDVKNNKGYTLEYILHKNGDKQLLAEFEAIKATQNNFYTQIINARRHQNF